MNKNSFIKLTAAFSCALLLVGNVEARKYQPVDCDDGDSISTALEQRNYNEKLQIEISGTCIEDVLIKDDDVMLIKNPSADTPPKVIGTITIDSAHRVEIKEMDVSSDTGAGFVVKNGSSASFESVSSEFNATDGMQVIDNSVAEISNSELSNNTGDSLAVSNGASVMVASSALSGNTGNGANSENNATTSITDGSEIFANQAYGISADKGSVMQVFESDIDRDTSSGEGAYAGNHSYLEFSDTTIKGDVDLFNNSTVKDAVVEDSLLADSAINADLASSVIGSSADEINAFRRSLVVETPPDKLVEIKLNSQSVGDKAAADDECDSTSSVFEDGNLDPDEVGCLRDDLDHVFSNVIDLNIGQDALDAAVAILEGAVDWLIDKVEDLLDAI
jgi:hypothetical protein